MAEIVHEPSSQFHTNTPGHRVASQATSDDSVEEGLVSAYEGECTSEILPLDSTIGWKQKRFYAQKHALVGIKRQPLVLYACLVVSKLFVALP